MSRGLNRLIVAIVRPPLIVIRFVMGNIYSLLFGWADRSLARKHEEQLAHEIRENLPFLFKEYGGQIVLNEGVRFPPPFDYAIITVATGDLLFRFVRGRGSLGVQLAPLRLPYDWHELSSVLSVIATPEGALPQTDYYRLQNIARLLQVRMGDLKEAFSEDRYAEMKERLSEVYDRNARATRRLEGQINRKLYGS